MFGGFGDSLSYDGVTGNRNPLQMHRSQYNLFGRHPRSSVSRSSPMPTATVEAAKKASFEEKFLESHIDPNYGLLEKLMASGTLSPNEYEAIRNNGSVLKKNQELITIYKAKNQHAKLLDMLRETDQEHLNNHLHKLRGQQPDVNFDDNLPLAVRQEVNIDLNRDVVADLLSDPSELADRLYCKSVINKRQKDHIQSLPASMAAQVFLDVLRRRSIRNFYDTIECLCEMGQDLVAKILNGEVVGRIKCRVLYNNENIKDQDVQLEQKLNNCDQSTYELDIRRNGFLFVQSISGSFWLYFHFSSFFHISGMCKDVQNDNMKTMVENDFCKLLNCSQEAIRVMIEWPGYDYERCIRCHYNNIRREIDGLQVELLDMILSKVVLLQMYFGDKANRPTDPCIFFGLASVSRLWSSRITGSKSKKWAKRQLTADSDYFRKVKKRSTIIKHNKDFLKYVLEPDVLLGHLQTTGCFTEDKITSLRRIGTRKDKNDELLFHLANFTSQKYLNFLQCLYVTNQLSAATVLQYGGETIKMHVTISKTSQQTNLENSLVENIRKANSKQWIHLSDKHGLGDAFILQAEQEQGITVWLWFTTETAWKKMKTICQESPQHISQEVLLDIMRELVLRVMPESTVRPQRVQINCANFDNIFAERKLLVEEKRSFTIIGWAEHVAVLMDKIYVSQKRSILVYKNQEPYPQLQVLRFPTTTVDNSLPIKVSETRSCLYAPDQITGCIHKIEPMCEHRMTTWLKEAGSLVVAVSCSGDVFVLDRKMIDTSLRVFSYEGVLKASLPISSSFDESVQSVEEITSNLVALAYRKVDQFKPSGASGFVLVMPLDDIGTVLRKIICESPLKCLVPFPCWQLLVGEQRNQRLSLHDYKLFSNRLEILLDGNLTADDMCFSSDRKQLLVLVSDFNADMQCEVCIYKMNYEDEDYD